MLNFLPREGEYLDECGQDVRKFVAQVLGDLLSSICF